MSKSKQTPAPVAHPEAALAAAQDAHSGDAPPVTPVEPTATDDTAPEASTETTVEAALEPAIPSTPPEPFVANPTPNKPTLEFGVSDAEGASIRGYFVDESAARQFFVGLHGEPRGNVLPTVACLTADRIPSLHPVR